MEVRRRHNGRDRVWDLYRRSGRKVLTLVLDRSAIPPLRGLRPFAVVLHWSEHGGSGYVGGWSAYLVVKGQRQQQRRFLFAGITRNANAVPWVSH